MSAKPPNLARPYDSDGDAERKASAAIIIPVAILVTIVMGLAVHTVRQDFHTATASQTANQTDTGEALVIAR